MAQDLEGAIVAGAACDGSEHAFALAARLAAFPAPHFSVDLEAGVVGGLGIAAVGVSIYARTRMTQRIVPFASVGYASLSDEITVSGRFYAGGMGIWFGRRIGARLEYRYLEPTSRSWSHYHVGRLGLMWH